MEFEYIDQYACTRGSGIEIRRTSSCIDLIQGAIKKMIKYRKGKKIPPKQGDGPGENSHGHKVGFTVKCYFCARRDM